MMLIPRINCIHFDKRGGCAKKPRSLFGLFKASCCEAHIDGVIYCDVKEKYPRPKHMPPPPPMRKPND